MCQAATTASPVLVFDNGEQTIRTSILRKLIPSKKRNSRKLQQASKPTQLKAVEDCCSSLTTAVDFETVSERSASLNLFSCLKVKTQVESLQQEYETLVEEATEDDDSTTSKSVSFNTVTIHCHDMILGDNPCPVYGPPVTIGWRAYETVEYTVEEYNPINDDDGYTPRKGPEMILPSKVRHDIISKKFPRSEIASTIRTAAHIRRQRISSARAKPWPFNQCY